MALEIKLWRKAKRVATTETFKKDFPRGIEMLNNVGDRYYFFDKEERGKIRQGVFVNSVYAGMDDFWQRRYDYIYDRQTKETYQLGESVNVESK